MLMFTKIPAKALDHISIHRVLTKAIGGLKKHVNVIQFTWKGGEKIEDLSRALNLQNKNYSSN